MTGQFGDGNDPNADFYTAGQLGNLALPASPSNEQEPQMNTKTDYTAMEGTELLAACGSDASKWAAAFNQTAVKLGYSEMDEGWLIGWFANAIMHSLDVVNGTGPVVLPDGSAFFYRLA